MLSTTATELLAELRSLGIELQADGNRLRYRPRSAMTPDLAGRARAHKPELLAILAAERSDPSTSAPFRFTDEIIEFGDVCAGWTPEGWASELRRKADCCDEIRPDIAQYYRSWAVDIERRLHASMTRRLNDED